jgi:hypothetical protein
LREIRRRKRRFAEALSIESEGESDHAEGKGCARRDAHGDLYGLTITPKHLNGRGHKMKFVCLGYIEPGKFEHMPEDERNRMIDSCFSYDDVCAGTGTSPQVRRSILQVRR